MNNTLVEILGPSRSGTTMLDLMLGNDDESFSMGEVCALFRPFRTHHFAIDCNCGDAHCPYWEKLSQLEEKDLYVDGFDILHVNYIIDSSKYLPWVIDSTKWTQKKPIRIVRFLLHKPMINYCYSFWKRGYDLEVAFRCYKTYYRRFFQTGLHAYAVSYEELIRHPEETLDGLCKITGQQSFPQRKAFWEKEHHHLFGSGGARKQNRKGQSQIKGDVFPVDFKKVIPEIKDRMERDTTLKRISAQLEEIDFNASDGESLPHTRSQSVHPYWYYYLKMKGKWKTKFPENYRG